MMNTPPTTQLRRQSLALLASFFVACAALLPAVARAQVATGTVTGRVLNQGTGEYLRNAAVEVVGTGLATTAEAGGNFSIGNVPSGPQTLRVAYAGLDSKDVTVNVVGGQSTNVEVVLTSGAYSDVVQLGAFVVASEREGNAKVIMEQKASIEAKAVLAADSFGSISEGNVGEFLKYLPGVQIDYVEADARSVSLGGMDPKYTAVTIDGSPVASSGMAAASGTGANRGFEFEQISIHNIETVELTRTPQPENPGTAMAGIVNLRSRGAFDSAGRRLTFNAGVAWNSMSGNPFQKQPGWDDEKHYRIQPNFGFNYSDVFLNKKLGVQVGYNYSFTFSEQKALTVNYAFDNNLTNNDTEIARISNFQYRDSPKPTIRYNGNVRIDYKFTPQFWISARADYSRYHAKFFSRDITFNMLPTVNQDVTIDGKKFRVNYNPIANSPDPDGAPGASGAGRFPAGPQISGVPFSWSSQTVVADMPGVNDAGVLQPTTKGPGGSIGIHQGGGGTNKYGSTSNFFLGAYFTRGSFRADTVASMSRSMTWYKDRHFGFFWSLNPSALGNLGFRVDRNGPADPAIFITQTSGADWRNLANHPAGFSATTNDRQGEDQRWQFRSDMQYSTRLKSIPTIFKWGLHINQWVNNSDRPIAGYSSTFRGADNVAKTADDSLTAFVEPDYRMNFDFGGNVDGMANIDRWAAYKVYQTHPEAWTYPTPGQILGYKLGNARDAQEQVDALYQQTILKFGKFTLAPGVRVEHTRGRASGPADLGDRNTFKNLVGVTDPIRAVDAATNPGLGWTTADRDAFRQTEGYLMTRYAGARQTARQDYNTWLRYVHMTYRFTPNLVLKGSWNQALSRPDMNRLIGGLVVTNDDPDNTSPNQARAGNRNLIPELSRTANLTLEYYTKGIGQIRVSGYRRDFENLLRTVRYEIPAGGSWNGEPLPTAVSPNEPWLIETVENIGKAHGSALEFELRRELDFLPGPLSRIVVNTNYTRMYFDNYENFRRPRNTANLSFYIPYKDVALRWNMNWVPGRRVEDINSSSGWAKHNRESFTHTMDLTYRLNRTFQFYLTARNIFNQDQGEYRGRSDIRTRWVKTGAIWTTGVRADF